MQRSRLHTGPVRFAPTGRFLVLALGALALAAPLGRPPAAAEPTQGTALEDDPLLAALTAQALQHRPELAQARARLDAERERVPQVGALPDPNLTLGIQNDGFSRIEIGRMETSFASIMASQTFPFFGKQGLRTQVATLAARSAEADLARVELSVRAEVERAYLEVLRVRDQLGLLSKLDALWSQAEGLSRTRYESGDGAQTDILRAQLERTRLRQRRWSLEAEQRRGVTVLNRLSGRALDESLPTTRALSDLPDPPLREPGPALADAEARSPELQKARLSIDEAGRRVELARKDVIPDPTVSLGLMLRGGEFPPMWQASISVPLPVWAGRKQSRAVTENQAWQRASAEGLEGLRHLLRQRMVERRTLLEAARETNQLFRAGLLVQSQATVTSSLVQYQVGRLTFASVLEALIGYVGDEGGFLDSVAAAQRLAIADRELSLEGEGGPASSGMGTGSVPGTGTLTGGASAPTRPGSSEGGGGSSMPSRM